MANNLIYRRNVTEYIEGLVATYAKLLFINGPEVKIVTHTDAPYEKDHKVAVISGGGSGHEPADAGFVGQGMLTAAICGEVFTPPHHDAILEGIRAVTGLAGCLLIVKNYKDDRLNFGLAAERAKSEGYEVETVIVGDDCGLAHPHGITGRKGLAGTLLVQKVAGAAAAAGLPLAVVAADAKRASQFVGTMGIALSVCTLPGQVTSDHLEHGKMYLGVGIDGEPGTAVKDLESVDIVVTDVLTEILSREYVPIRPGDAVVLLVNGLGGTPLMELMIAARFAFPHLMVQHGLVVKTLYTGSLMTSLDMAGFSISVMKVDEAILGLLDAATNAPSWPSGVYYCPKMTIEPSLRTAESTGRPLQLTEQGHTLEAAIQAAANAVKNLCQQLNAWDRKHGDGTFGWNMYRGAVTILNDMESYYPLNDAAETINQIGSSIIRVISGTNGKWYGILFAAGCARLRADFPSPVSPMQWAEAFKASITAVSAYGGATTGDRTMLDALIPASSVLLERLDAGDPPTRAFVLSAEAAWAGAQKTDDSADILASDPDPGAMAAGSWYKAAASAVHERHQAP